MPSCLPLSCRLCCAYATRRLDCSCDDASPHVAYLVLYGLVDLPPLTFETTPIVQVCYDGVCGFPCECSCTCLHTYSSSYRTLMACSAAILPHPHTTNNRRRTTYPNRQARHPASRAEHDDRRTCGCACTASVTRDCDRCKHNRPRSSCSACGARCLMLSPYRVPCCYPTTSVCVVQLHSGKSDTGLTQGRCLWGG